MKALKLYVLIPRYIMINTLDMMHDTVAQVQKKKKKIKRFFHSNFFFFFFFPLLIFS